MKETPENKQRSSAQLSSKQLSSKQPSRRQLVAGSVAATGAVAAGAAFGISQATKTPENQIGLSQESFYGAHQAGLSTDAQAQGTFISFDLKEGITLAQVRSLMKIWSDDAHRLMEGQAALADMEPELARIPSRLTITFGFGPTLFDKIGIAHRKPSWLKFLPAFKLDKLDEAHSNGDIMVQICADDAVTVAHATRIITKDARSFVTVRWQEQGFRNAAGSVKKGETTRNLFGQLDGSRNPNPKDAKFNEIMWSKGSGETAWVTGGTSMVFRKIHMDLDNWDQIDRSAREIVIGRNLDNGAPLSGKNENDEPDLNAVGSNGLSVIPEYAHIRRARTSDDTQRIVRRPYNYDTLSGGSGLLFTAYQADPVHQYIPLQERLDELDLLNKWITHVASAVFAVPPGCQAGGYIGEGFLS